MSKLLSQLKIRNLLQAQKFYLVFTTVLDPPSNTKMNKQRPPQPRVKELPDGR